MKKIYLDNASTSFPKAPQLGLVMGEHIDNYGVNISRGNYMQAYSVESKVIETRQEIQDMFNIESIKNISFVSGATIGLNMAIKGTLDENDNIITTSMEHNAVVRPIHDMIKEKNITWSMIPCDTLGNINIENLENIIKPNTKLVLVNHASNVNGTISPIEEIGQVCKKHNILFAVDASQSAGSVNVDMKKSNIDILVFPGHKSLLGPQGIGCIALSENAIKYVKPIISGGTGSVSHYEYMPDFMPDKYQPGTLNIPGIIGLNHSIKYIKQIGLENIKKKKSILTKSFIEGVKGIEGVKLIGKLDLEERCAVVSLDFIKIDNAQVSYLLESQYGIMTRCGIHCAPYAHKSFDTYPQGTVRFSFGYFNELNEIDYAIEAIKNITK